MKRQIEVTQIIEVEVDESKFDEQFLREFRESFYSFDTLDEHIEHLGQLYARGIFSGLGNPFIEGYGPADEMGIKFREIDQEQRVLDEREEL